ncbi:MAG: gfo/Idh/MocA family oxidoreductase [Planctomycetota bacterium]|nr:MAG: gfo/Idh/MocA family oxidoreductase [Planctomycetota bacterium]
MLTRHTRRQFIQRASAVSVGAWIAAGTPVWSEARSANEKLDVGVIGAGGRGRSNLNAVGETENIVALCDVDSERLAQSAADYSTAATYSDYRAMLDEEKLDAVIVSTPDHTHAPAAVAAMQSGRHVYCEKPLAHSVYEARRMAEVARETGVVTQMGNQSHATDRLRRVVEIVRSGQLGPVHEVICWSNKQFSGGDRPTESPPVPPTLDWNLWLGPAAERPYHPDYLPFTWRGWWDFGSGNFGDMGCHIIDAPCWALELDYPTSILAAGPPPHVASSPTALVVRYEFPARGERPPVRLTWYDGSWAPPYEMIDDVELPAQGSLIMGEEGQLLFPHTKGDTVLFPRQRFADLESPEPMFSRPAHHHAEWIEACKGRGETLSNFEYGGRMTEFILAGVVAYRMGRVLEWDGPNMTATNCPEADALIKPPMRKGWEV